MTGTISNLSEEPIASPEDLLRYFTAGIKPPPRWGVGLEYERLGVDVLTGEAAPYSGPRGIEAILAGMAERFGWTADREDGRIIGLARRDSSITLEPGGQLELSGRVHPDIFKLRGEMACFLDESAQIAEPLGLAFITLGLQPITPVEAIEWVPKGRYGIMGPFLGARGDLAHHMMKGTAGVQINFDYGSEDDAMEKLRLAMAISPIATAASANSPLGSGRETGFLSRRAHIWTRTDPARSGFPEFVFREDLTFRDYLDYTLKVPMLFVRRDNHWVDMGGLPFGDFLRDGHRGMTAVEADWMLHMTTIFTEVRLKSYVEVRGLDSVPPALALAFAVFWKGILYDERARREAWKLVAPFSWKERLAFYDDVARTGPAARLGEASAGELALELLALSRQGLERICGCSDLPPCSREEAHLLDPLEASLRGEGGCPGARLLESWRHGLAGARGGFSEAARRDMEAFLTTIAGGCAGEP